jgi:hypothetical protein
MVLGVERRTGSLGFGLGATGGQPGGGAEERGHAGEYRQAAREAAHHRLRSASASGSGAHMSSSS